MDEFDQLLGDIGEDTDSLPTVDFGDEVKPEVNPIVKPNLAVKVDTENNISVSTSSQSANDEDIPELVGNDIPEQYRDLVERVRYQYRCLPKLNYKEIYEELSDLAIKSHPSPTLQMINDEIQKVQAAKERLSEIYRNVERNFHLKKRSIDILESAWAKYTDEKSADKRKGDAMYRISNFITDFALTEACYKVCHHIIKNLDSSHESLSRQITVNQLLLKMNDYGRSGSLPDYDFENKKAESDITDQDSDDSGELKDCNF